jgi:hypothetical protein
MATQPPPDDPTTSPIDDPVPEPVDPPIVTPADPPAPAQRAAGPRHRSAARGAVAIILIRHAELVSASRVPPDSAPGAGGTLKQVQGDEEGSKGKALTAC